MGAHRFSLADTQTLLSVVFVMLVGSDRKIATYALLDPDREVTLIREDMARELGLASRPKPIRTSTFHGRDPPMELKAVDFRISTEDSSLDISVENALTVPRLNVSALLKADWPHLAIVEPANMRPESGAGTSHRYHRTGCRRNPRLQRDRKGRQTAPRAKLTRFGWTVVGKVGNRYLLNNSNRQRHVNFVRRSTFNDELMEALEWSWTTETFGVKSSYEPMSTEDKFSMEILESTIALDKQRYEVGLLWKRDAAPLPGNRDSAMKRFFGLEKRFRSKSDYGKRYPKVIEKSLELGHARRLKPEDLLGPVGRTWYLPHHGVEQNEKLRVVFDASYSHQGQSLNDQLLKGPDLMTPLFGVLVRFRVKAFAVSADIEKMFPQVRVKICDRDVDADRIAEATRNILDAGVCIGIITDYLKLRPAKNCFRQR